MTCQELHSYFADPLRVDADLSANCAEVAEHIVACADCNRFVEAQRELWTSLRLARESAPRLSVSLDAAVLATIADTLRRGRALSLPLAGDAHLQFCAGAQ
ncbi:MAG: hypothetical protein DMG73_20415 [Acidobacteria bacterium]|nr:MAG: hypothetical protein DMG73_20415 [Acidobacteriota bacterium]